MSNRSAKDVFSRCGHIEKILGVSAFDGGTMALLTDSTEFKESSVYVRPQLKRALTLQLEYMHTQEGHI